MSVNALLTQINNNNCFDRNATLVIKKEAVVNNVRYISKATGAKIIAVVKENGYGLGVANLYNIIRDQDIFMYAVAAPCEALALRKEGCKTDILMLTPIADYNELLLMVSNNVVLPFGNANQIPALLDIYERTGMKPRVHIQIDSGLGRYGFSIENMPDFNHYKNFLSIEGCFSHLAGSSNNYRKSVEKQVDVFNAALDKIKASGIDPGICHIANSKATVAFGSLGFDAVRVGSAIIGKVPLKSELDEAVWLESEVFSVINRPEGEHIGYRGEVMLKRDSDIAVVRIGTSDGIGLMQRDRMEYSIGNIVKNVIRRINNVPVLCVWINGKKSPVIGRIGVGHMTVDVTGNAVKEGDIVKLQVNPLQIHPYVKRMVI